MKVTSRRILSWHDVLMEEKHTEMVGLEKIKKLLGKKK